MTPTRFACLVEPGLLHEAVAVFNRIRRRLHEDTASAAITGTGTCCPRCQHRFDAADVPECAMGAVRCPSCRTSVTQEHDISNICNDGRTIGDEVEDDSGLAAYARRELELAGLFDADSDYNGMIGHAVMELIREFARQGHSGTSAAMVMGLFGTLGRYMPLTPIGTSADEWQVVTDDEPLWQNRRRSTTFSRDGGRTWYDIDNPVLNNGDTWEGQRG